MPEPTGHRVQLSCGAMACVYVPSASAWHNTLYRAVLVYAGMHKTLETLALHMQVSKPVFTVITYICKGGCDTSSVVHPVQYTYDSYLTTCWYCCPCVLYWGSALFHHGSSCHFRGHGIVQTCTTNKCIMCYVLKIPVSTGLL